MGGSLRVMTRLLVIAGMAGALMLPAAADARLGSLRQLPGKAGCVAQQSSASVVKRSCSVAHFAGREFFAAAASPDRRNLYVLSVTGGLTTFRIRGGHLEQAGRCLSPTGRGRCKRLPQFFHTNAIGISPDSRTVYAGAATDAGKGEVLIFRRNPRTGALRKIGCVADGGAAGCGSARGMFRGVTEIVATRDGRSVYVGSNSADPIAAKSGALAVFARSRSGRLTQLAGPAGCLNGTGGDGCTQVRALGPTCCGIAASPDSRNLYVSSSTGGAQSATFALGIFSRSAATGALTQLPGSTGCVNKDGSAGCAAAAFGGGTFIDEAGAVLVSPNGRDIYLAHSSTFPEAESSSCGGSDDFVAHFGRALAGGALGPLGQDLVTCGSAAVMSPDGRSVYASSGDFGSTVSVLSRDRHTGRLTKAGCVGHESRGCRAVRHANAPDAVVMDGNRFVYVLSNDPVEGSTIGVFKRTLR
jgi:hypothetical protein